MLTLCYTIIISISYLLFNINKVSGSAFYWHMLKDMTQIVLALIKVGTGSREEAQQEGSKASILRPLSFKCAVPSSGATDCPESPVASSARPLPSAWCL